MSAKYLLGIDCGTSIVKCCIMDLEGNECAVASRKIPILVPKPTWAEENMYDFWNGVTEIIPEAMAKLGITGEEILGIGVTGQGEGNWMIDKNGEPLQNAILWTDGRAGSIVNEWMENGTVEEAFKITGIGPFAGSSVAVLRWQILNQPEVLERAQVNLYSKDWIQFKLTGVACGDTSDTSLFGLDIRNRCYDDRVMKLYGVLDYKHLVPKHVPSTDIMGYVTEEAAAVTGLKVGTPVVKGMYDMPASAAGVGCVNSGDACVILGTTLAFEVITPEPVLEPPNMGMVITHGIPGLYVKAVSTNYGMPNLEWFIRNLGHSYKAEAEKRGLPIYTILEEALARTSVGADGVIFSPYLCPGGERAPFVKPEARGQFIGITEDHNLDHLCRAVYEGLALSMMDCIASVPIELGVISLCGGGAKSDVFCQMLCDAAGVPFQIPEGTEFGAKGVAMFAGVATGVFGDHNEAVKHCLKIDRRFEPNMENHAKYQELYKVYLKAREAQMGVWDDLAAVRAKL